MASGASALAILLGLITTPVLLHALGLTQYGALAVIGSLTTYVGIFDFGIGGSLSRYMTIYEEQRDDRALAGVTTFAWLFYGGMAVIVFPLVFFSATAIGRFLGFPAALQADLPGLLMILLCSFFASSLSGVLSARLMAVHRLDVSAYLSMATSVLAMLMTLILVPRYPNLYTVFACGLVQVAFASVGMYVAIARLTGRRPLTFGRISLQEIKGLLSFGVWTQLSGITSIVNLEADKVIISHSVGVADVAPYQVANRIALLNRIFPLQIIGAMLPEVTAAISRGLDTAAIETLYARSSRSLMLATMFISGFVAGAADPLIRFWLGARLPWAAELCVALVLSYVLNNATGVGTTIIKAQGKPQLETTYGMISAILNIGMTVALVGPYGLFGVVAGTIIGNVVGSTFFLVVFHRRARLPWWETMGRWLSQLAVMMGGAGLCAYAIASAFGSAEVSRLRLLPQLLVTGCAYVVLFALFGYLIRFWTREDLDLLTRVRARFFPARRAAQ